MAELTSCMVGTVLGLPCDVENHASYLQSWLEVLREDRRAVFRAAAAAQKAADWMLALHPDFAQAAASSDEDQDGGAPAESPAAAAVPEGTPDRAAASLS